MDQMASQAEEAASRDNMGTLYLINKKLTSKSDCTRNQIKNKEGGVITEEQKVLERWKPHFEEMKIFKKNLSLQRDIPSLNFFFLRLSDCVYLTKLDKFFPPSLFPKFLRHKIILFEKMIFGKFIGHPFTGTVLTGCCLRGPLKTDKSSMIYC